jgi:hypothetical protein
MHAFEGHAEVKHRMLELRPVRMDLVDRGLAGSVDRLQVAA